MSSSSSLVWLKKENPDEPWTNLGGIVVDGRLESITPFSTLSEFAIGTTSSDNPLPVEISSINVAQEGGTIALTWTTSSELETYGFEVDRKLIAGQKVLGPSSSMTETSNWHLVGFLQGNGTTNIQHNYFLKDFVSPGEYCYRVKQVDRDGTIQHQNLIEVTVRLEEGDYGLKQNYPNPFNPATTFQFALKSTRVLT